MTEELYKKARSLNRKDYHVLCSKGANMSEEEYAIFCARADLHEIMLSEGDLGLNENIELRKIRCNFLYANCRQQAHYLNVQDKSYYCPLHSAMVMKGGYDDKDCSRFIRNKEDEYFYRKLANDERLILAEGEEVNKNKDHISIKCNFNHKICKVPPSYANDAENHYCFIHSVMIQDKRYNFPGRLCTI